MPPCVSLSVGNIINTIIRLHVHAAGVDEEEDRGLTIGGGASAWLAHLVISLRFRCYFVVISWLFEKLKSDFVDGKIFFRECTCTFYFIPSSSQAARLGTTNLESRSETRRLHSLVVWGGFSSRATTSTFIGNFVSVCVLTTNEISKLVDCGGVYVTTVTSANSILTESGSTRWVASVVDLRGGRRRRATGVNVVLDIIVGGITAKCTARKTGNCARLVAVLIA